MADFERSLQLLAERGDPIGPEELIERIERQLAGEPRVVVPEQPRTPIARVPRRRGLAWAVAAFIGVIAIGTFLLLLTVGGENEFVDTTIVSTTATPPTTQAATPTTDPPVTAAPVPATEDVELTEQLIAAWYGNDFETITELLTIPTGAGEQEGWTAEDVRNRMAYDSVVGARAEGLTCEPNGEIVTCTYSLQNTLVDAIGLEPHDEDVDFRIVDGEFEMWEFSTHIFLSDSMRAYLGFIGDSAAVGDCHADRLDEECGLLYLSHLDGWAEWNSTPAETIALRHVEALFDGDCATLWALIGPREWDAQPPLAAELESGTFVSCLPEVEYELAMSGTLDVSNCEAASEFQGVLVRCDGSYSNVLSRAVAAAPAEIQVAVFVDRATEDHTWDATSFRSAHPEDRDLLLSVRRWALEVGLGADVDEACGLRMEKTAECATFLLDSLDAWAAWYSANN